MMNINLSCDHDVLDVKVSVVAKRSYNKSLAYCRLLELAGCYLQLAIPISVSSKKLVCPTSLSHTVETQFCPNDQARRSHLRDDESERDRLVAG